VEQHVVDPVAVWAGEFVAQVGLRPGERVLELGGGGDGAVARLAADRVGPDGEVASRELSTAMATGSLPFSDGEFDAVLCLVPFADQLGTADVLAEIGRVTALTGRIALGALPPAGDDSTELPELAAQAGLRWVQARTETKVAGSETVTVCLVTAFPPRPAAASQLAPDAGVEEPTAPIPVVRDTAQGTVPMIRRLVTGQVGGRRGRLVAASVVVLLAAVAIGVGWGLAGDRAPDITADPGSGPGLAGDSGSELAPGQSGVPDDPVAGGAGNGGGPFGGAGSGAGSSGGGGPGNQPPAIADAGLSSDGLTLTVAPTVADPDGDEVSLAVEADGRSVGMSGDPARGTISYPYQTYGAEHEASVTIVATDAAGGSTRETFTHRLQAVTTVSVEDVRFTLTGNLGRCLGGDVRARRLVGTLTLTGPAQDTLSVNHELRLDRTEVVLLDRREGTGPGAPTQSVSLQAEFAGQADQHVEVHSGERRVFDSLFTATDGCTGLLSYHVTVQRR
jgi:hypothetical protein